MPTRHKLRQHAEKRLRERYSQTNPREVLQRIQREISKSVFSGLDTSAVFVEKLSNSRSLFDVTIDLITYRVVYSKVAKEVITVFPQEE